MARQKTIVELVQARARAEARVFRHARRRGNHRHRHPLSDAVQLLADLDDAALALARIDAELEAQEREARRAVKKLVRKPRLVR